MGKSNPSESKFRIHPKKDQHGSCEIHPWMKKSHLPKHHFQEFYVLIFRGIYFFCGWTISVSALTTFTIIFWPSASSGHMKIHPIWHGSCFGPQSCDTVFPGLGRWVTVTHRIHGTIVIFSDICLNFHGKCKAKESHTASIIVGFMEDNSSRVSVYLIPWESINLLAINYKKPMFVGIKNLHFPWGLMGSGTTRRRAWRFSLSFSPRQTSTTNLEKGTSNPGKTLEKTPLFVKTLLCHKDLPLDPQKHMENWWMVWKWCQPNLQ